MEFCIYISRGVFTEASKKALKILRTHKYIAVLQCAAYTTLHATWASDISYKSHAHAPGNRKQGTPNVDPMPRAPTCQQGFTI